jgi:hypothetical protein
MAHHLLEKYHHKNLETFPVAGTSQSDGSGSKKRYKKSNNNKTLF